MWIQAILSKDDLVTVVHQFMPLNITFNGKGNLLIHEPTEVMMVAGRGVRVACKANLHWPVLGIAVPVTIKETKILLRPEVLKVATGDRLVFKIAIEEAEVAGIPSMLDGKIVEKVNSELAEKHIELSWNFAKTLTHSFDLPDSLAPLKTFDLKVVWGEIKATDDGLVWAVSFESSVTRAPS